MGMKEILKNHKDKVYHFAAGGMIALLAILFLHMTVNLSLTVQYLIGIISSLAAGAYKEQSDMYDSEHTSDGWDAYWTVAGGIFAVSMLFAIKSV